VSSSIRLAPALAWDFACAYMACLAFALKAPSALRNKF
jgi:hypothetical protein